MKEFMLILSSPDGNIFAEKITKIKARGIEGEFAIMAGHIPFITSLVPCECVVDFSDGTQKKGQLQGGLLTVSKDAVTLLSGSFEWK